MRFLKTGTESLQLREGVHIVESDAEREPFEDFNGAKYSESALGLEYAVFEIGTTGA